MTTGHLCAPTQQWLQSGRHVEVFGKEVFITDHGVGPVVVFIHGFPTSGYDWKGVAAELSGEFRCVTLDLPGFGLSDKPVAYSYSLFQQADVVEGLLEELEIDRAHVVSHDMGTSVHTELLARESEGRLSFGIATSSFLNGSIIKGMAHLTEFQKLLEPPSRVPEALQVCAEILPVYVDRLKAVMVRPEMMTDEDVTVVTDLLRYQDGHLKLPAVYSYVRERYLHAERWLDAMKVAKAPLQLVWASGDPIAVEAMGDALAAQLPHARHIKVPDAGHFLPVEAPTVVARHLRSFIAPQT